MIQSYPWYIADWRESETRLSLTLAERGLYRELLDYCYLEGSFPSEESKIKLISSANGHEFTRAWKSVRSLFDLVSTPDGNRFEHSKVNEVRIKLLAYHQQKKHAGAISGKSRRERTLNVRSTAVEPIPTPDLISNTLISSPFSELNVRSLLSSPFSELVDRMYATHPKTGDLPSVVTSLRTALGENSPESEFARSIEACHKSWCETPGWKSEPHFVPKLGTWLADKGYTKWPPGKEPQPRINPSRIVPYNPYKLPPLDDEEAS